MFNYIYGLDAALSNCYSDNVQNDTVVSVDKEGTAVSCFKDDVWDFNALLNDGSDTQAEYQIKFFTNKHNHDLLQDFKKRAYYLLWTQTGLFDSDSKLRAFKAVSTICKQCERTLRVFKDTPIKRLSQLSNEMVFEIWKQGLQGLSEGSIKSALTSLKAIESVNDAMAENDKLFLPLFEQNKLAKSLASSGAGNYPVVVPEIYQQLLSKLINDVETAHNQLVSLTDVRSYAAENDITEKKAVRHFKEIEGSCFMTLSAFAGMRVSELVSVEYNSFYTIEIDGITMSALSLKTIKLEQGIKREDIWACAPICEKALDVLTHLWSKDRDDAANIKQRPSFYFGTGDKITSQKGCLQITKNELKNIFKRHSEHLNISYIPETMGESYDLLNPRVNKRIDPRVNREDGTVYWRFSTHSLRRSFAHFCVGHGVVSLGALKQQFKHITIAMTAIYAERGDILSLLGVQHDKKLKKELEASELDYHKSYLRDVVEHPDRQSGGYAKELFHDKPKVLTTEQFETLASDTKAANTTTGYGRCFAGESCEMEHIFEPAGCVASECSNLNINKEEALRWSARHQHLSNNLNMMMESGLINKHTLARELSDVRAAEKVMKDHNIDFTRFEMVKL